MNPDGWNIPWDALVKRLKELSGGRVMRVDDARKWDNWLNQRTPPAELMPRVQVVQETKNVAGMDAHLEVDVPRNP